MRIGPLPAATLPRMLQIPCAEMKESNPGMPQHRLRRRPDCAEVSASDEHTPRNLLRWACEVHVSDIARRLAKHDWRRSVHKTAPRKNADRTDGQGNVQPADAGCLQHLHVGCGHAPVACILAERALVAPRVDVVRTRPQTSPRNCQGLSGRFRWECASWGEHRSTGPSHSTDPAISTSEHHKLCQGRLHLATPRQAARGQSPADE